jgi:hypothetical protein
MFNILSLLIGGFALLLAIPALLPLLGWMNWIVIPLSVLGLGIGVISKSKAGRNLNLVVLVIAALRLMLGGGFL